MMLPINEDLYIASNPLNWIVARGTPKPKRHREPRYYGHLKSALFALTQGEYGVINDLDLDGVRAICKRLEATTQVLEETYLSPNPLSALIKLGIQFEVCGFRFILNDPYNVHRQIQRKMKWVSKQYYRDLPQALTSTLIDLIRSENTSGVQEASRVIGVAAKGLMAIKDGLPEDYWKTLPAITSKAGVKKLPQADYAFESVAAMER